MHVNVAFTGMNGRVSNSLPGRLSWMLAMRACCTRNVTLFKVVSTAEKVGKVLTAVVETEGGKVYTGV